jgi:hypothetical protein
MQIVDLQLQAGAPESRADRTALVGEDAARAAAEPPLFGQQRPGVQAGGVEKRQLLVVAGLVARVLAVAHEHGPVLLVDILPRDAADLVLAHGRGDRETHDAGERDDLARVGVEVGVESVELRLGRATVALPPAPDEAEALQGRAGEVHRLGRDGHPMYSGRMGQDRLHVAKVHTDCDRAGALLRSIPAELDQTLAGDVAQRHPAELGLERVKARCVGATSLAHLQHVLDVELDQVAKCGRCDPDARGGGLAAVDVALHVQGQVSASLWRRGVGRSR